MRFLPDGVFLLVAHLLIVRYSDSTFVPDSTASQHGDETNQIEEAIKICRETLDVDPNFPKVQHSLAKLLDSQIDRQHPKKDQVAEVINLYYAVGIPPSYVGQSSRMPPVSIRFQSLCRAASISDEVLHDASNAIRYYTSAMKMEGVDCEPLTTVLDIVIPLILSSVIEKRENNMAISPIGAAQSLQQQYLQLAMDLCDNLSTQCPNDPSAAKYRGAILRKMKRTSLAYESYLTAARV